MFASGWAPWHYFVQSSQQIRVDHTYLHFTWGDRGTDWHTELLPSPMASVGRVWTSWFNLKVYALWLSLERGLFRNPRSRGLSVGGESPGLVPRHLGSISSSVRDQQCDAQQATATFRVFICQMQQLKEMTPEGPSPSPLAGFSEELFPGWMTQAWGWWCWRGNHPPSPLSLLHSLVHHWAGPFHMSAVLLLAPMTAPGGWGLPCLFLWISPLPKPLWCLKHPQRKG